MVIKYRRYIVNLYNLDVFFVFFFEILVEKKEMKFFSFIFVLELVKNLIVILLRKERVFLSLLSNGVLFLKRYFFFVFVDILGVFFFLV